MKNGLGNLEASISVAACSCFISNADLHGLFVPTILHASKLHRGILGVEPINRALEHHLDQRAFWEGRFNMVTPASLLLSLSHRSGKRTWWAPACLTPLEWVTPLGQI